MHEIPTENNEAAETLAKQYGQIFQLLTDLSERAQRASNPASPQSLDQLNEESIATQIKLITYTSCAVLDLLNAQHLSMTGQPIPGAHLFTIVGGQPLAAADP